MPRAGSSSPAAISSPPSSMFSSARRCVPYCWDTRRGSNQRSRAALSRSISPTAWSVRASLRRLPTQATLLGSRGRGQGARSGRELQRRATGGAHERFEHGSVLGAVGEHLGVPLDAEAEGGARILDGLDRAVGRRGDHLEPLAEVLDRLVMEAVDLEAAVA